MRIKIKDPDATLRYQMNWSDYLGSDTIASSTWIVPTGLTKESETYTTTAGIVVISGGTAGERYTITNRITTAGGETDDRSISIHVRNR